MPQPDPIFCADAFDGMTRLFPLPGTVLYPHAVQALHVFEPRYRELLQDAMSSDRLISMAILKPNDHLPCGCEPPIEPCVCLGQVISRTQFDDGRANVLLMGLRRARIVEEIASHHPFRVARIELLSDQYAATSQSSERLVQRLLAAFRQCMPKSALAARQLTQSLGDDVCLGVLTDLISHVVRVSDAEKLRLLAEVHVERRAKILLRHLKRICEPSAGESSDGDFPPDFSVN